MKMSAGLECRLIGHGGEGWEGSVNIRDLSLIASLPPEMQKAADIYGLFFVAIYASVLFKSLFATLPPS